MVAANSQFTLERLPLPAGHELAHRLIDIHSLSKRGEEAAANSFAGASLMPRNHLPQEAGKCRNALGY